MMFPMAGAAVVVILSAVFIARFALGGKGTISGKMAAILAVLITLWVIIATQSTSTATSVAHYGAGGVTTALTGVTSFLDHLFK